MGDDHDDFAGIRNLAQILHQRPRHRPVQTGIRLVKEEQRRSADIFHCDAQTLALSAAELPDIGILFAFQTQHMERLVHACGIVRLAGRGGHPHLGGVAERGIDRVVFPHQILLRDEANLVFHLLVFFINVRAAIADGALCLLIAHDGVHEGGLACAGASENQHHARHGDVKPDIFEEHFLFQAADHTALLNINAQSRRRIRRGHTRLYGLRRRIFRSLRPLRGIFGLRRGRRNRTRRYALRRWLRFCLPIQRIARKQEVKIRDAHHIHRLKILRLFQMAVVARYAVQTAMVDDSPAVRRAKEGGVPPRNCAVVERKAL